MGLTFGRSGGSGKFNWSITMDDDNSDSFIEIVMIDTRDRNEVLKQLKEAIKDIDKTWGKKGTENEQTKN